MGKYRLQEFSLPGDYMNSLPDPMEIGFKNYDGA
jgi:hypothetical protein